ncbi:hypothetical protein A3F00_01070 [Candidatus Daviesbacteria bacterium RIFCSPHIGHO2_12_FULL_37_11]|uniref:Nucleotidase n=1 Tax=Candidatus Daviesbacteria bacterium RIFCSPHIGHO2_12_FULL_37_11 TaxID=1797777 RepID=A0A1F5KA12_9BACT|nr:MAG: hypothetical protein A2769_00040 [Candidatus Daviesbacteria bacterium RIFCSPHIGHO2_01_FULL_37_27]OGE37441.1 MAG: hypothetical protein A3F00_01070 [Candidatus Daviesbacteria bacterium RIFCSPHIGHO2_12_FULL_37_11]OGE44728.1 MAG: hypothetical protein A3B39_01440 [Candidatus Daviesbacteria bacterium RIFCSPLOWO2_01_FULL_37_10]
MKIGFDLDGIFIDGPPIIPKGIIEWLYRGSQNHDPKYRFPTTKFEQTIRKWSHSPIFRPEISRNVEFIKQLSKDKGLKIYLISSRYKFLENETMIILKKYGLENSFSKIFLNAKNEQPHLFKKNVLSNLKLDIFVEDDLIILKFLKNYYPKTTLLWYNPKRGIRLSEGIFHIKDLKDIYSSIK